MVPNVAPDAAGQPLLTPGVSNNHGQQQAPRSGWFSLPSFNFIRSLSQNLIGKKQETPTKAIDEDDFTMVAIPEKKKTVNPVGLLKELAHTFSINFSKEEQFHLLCDRIAQLDDTQLDIEFTTLLLPFVTALQRAPKYGKMREIYKEYKKGPNSRFKLHRGYFFKKVKVYRWSEGDYIYIKTCLARYRALRKDVIALRTELWQVSRNLYSDPTNEALIQKFQKLEEELRIPEFQILATLNWLAQDQLEKKENETYVIWSGAAMAVAVVALLYFMPAASPPPYLAMP